MRRILPLRLVSSSCLGALALTLGVAGCRSPAERAADAVLEKNLEARGGLTAWRKVQAMAMSGTMEAGVPRDPYQLAQSYLRTRTESKGAARRAAVAHQAEVAKQVQLPFSMELKRPHRSRVEVKFQGQTAVQVYDGAAGWKVRPFLGRSTPEPYTAEELALAHEQAELDGLLIDHAAKGEKVELAGTERLDGRDTLRLKVTLASGQARTVWVDAQTFLEVRVDGSRRLDGKERRVFTTFRDYRPVEGLLIPHTLETTVEGLPGAERIVVERVSLNPEVADARFAKPN